MEEILSQNCSHIARQEQDHNSDYGGSNKWSCLAVWWSFMTDGGGEKGKIVGEDLYFQFSTGFFLRRELPTFMCLHIDHETMTSLKNPHLKRHPILRTYRNSTTKPKSA